MRISGWDSGWEGWWDGWCDLVLGSACVACAAPGRVLCRRCASRLPVTAEPCWPDPAPPGLCPPWAVGPYAAPLRPMVLAHKERGRLALAQPLGRLLAVSARLACGSGAAYLVPVPSHRAVVRGRGHDPLLRVARVAAAELRRGGVDAAVLPALTVVGRPLDQAGLDAAGRAANLAGRFAARVGVVAAALADPRPVVLVDDVVTTGVTLREAQRALEGAGAPPVGAALVAATRRRSRSVEEGGESGRD